MKTFTQVLPRLLEKLEVVRMVLEAHGVEELTVSEISEFQYSWMVNRGRDELSVELYTGRDEDDEYEGARTELRLYVCGGYSLRVLYVHSSEVWTWALLKRKGDPAPDLVKALPDYDLETGYSESAAREAMGMICTFFTKLPVDAPSKAAATP